MDTVLLLLPLENARNRTLAGWFPHLPYQLTIEINDDCSFFDVDCRYHTVKDVVSDAFDTTDCRIEYGLVSGWLDRLRFLPDRPIIRHPYDELFNALYQARVFAASLPEEDLRRPPLRRGIEFILDRWTEDRDILRPMLTPPFRNASL